MQVQLQFDLSSFRAGLWKSYSAAAGRSIIPDPDALWKGLTLCEYTISGVGNPRAIDRQCPPRRAEGLATAYAEEGA
jgi:hypothetical protein